MIKSTKFMGILKAQGDMQYTVSIIVPVYNVEPYILHCLQSVANQTVTEGIECILVDDCGRDNSVKIAEDFISNYKGDIPFRILHHECNKGLSAARNTGIKASQGEYVYFLDSDDTIIPGCIEGFLDLISKYPNVDLLQGFISQDAPYMNQFEGRCFPEYTYDRKYIKKALLDYDRLPVCAANKMVRRQLIMEKELFFREGIIHEDNHWSYFLAKHISSLAILTTPTYIYRTVPGSITKNINKIKECESYTIILRDFCEHFDSFLLGEQKKCVLRMLNIVLEFQCNTTERKTLFHYLYDRCNIAEKVFIYIWFKTYVLKAKFFNFCIRIIEMTN